MYDLDKWTQVSHIPPAQDPPADENQFFNLDKFSGNGEYGVGISHNQVWNSDKPVRMPTKVIKEWGAKFDFFNLDADSD